jgi:hypothetical protein
MKKKKKILLIKDIQYIISQYGIFDIQEVLDATSPSVDTRGNLKSLIEGFQTDNAIVVVYKRDYAIVDTYRLSYEDMPLNTLKQVRAVCLLYQQLQLDLEN